MATWFKKITDLGKSFLGDALDESAQLSNSQSKFSQSSLLRSPTISIGKYFWGKPEKEDKEYWWYCPKILNQENQPQSHFYNEEIASRLEEKISHGLFTSFLDIPTKALNLLTEIDSQIKSFDQGARELSQSELLVDEFFDLAHPLINKYGDEIQDMSKLLSFLGTENIASILCFVFTRMKLSNKPIFRDFGRGIFYHCKTVATISRFLSKEFHLQPENAYLAGLLHDLGKFGIMREIMVDRVLQTKPLSYLTFERLDLLFEKFHQQVGESLATEWKLKPELAFVIGNHHDLKSLLQKHRKYEPKVLLSALVNLSDTMARILGKGKKITDTNIFNTPASEILGVVKDKKTIEFFDKIPDLV